MGLIGCREGVLGVVGFCRVVMGLVGCQKGVLGAIGC